MTATPKPKNTTPQGGYTPMPHSYFTVLGRKTSGFAQFYAIGYILDRTLGVPDKPKWAKLSCSTLARLTGLDSTSFQFALDDAVDRGLIERRKATCDGTCAFNVCTCAGRDWLYRGLPECWATAEDWQRKKLPKEDAGAAADGPQEDAGGAADENRRGDTLLVLPGKNSRPMLLSVAIKGVTEPVPMQLRYRNEVALPFSVHADVKGDIITVTVRSGASQESPERRTNSEPSLSGLSNRNASAKRTNGEALLSPLSNRGTTSISNQRFEDFKSYLNLVCLRHFYKAADDALIDEVLAKAGDAPIEDYAALVDERLSRRGRHSSGLLINLAADAHSTHRASLRNAPPQVSPEVHRLASLEKIREQVGDDPEMRAMLPPDIYAELFGASARGD